MRSTETRLQSKTEGEKMMSYISPFQDYPNNARTFIEQSDTSQAITPYFQQQVEKAKLYHRFKPRSSLNKVDITPQHDLALFS